jgi:hypothetical protein
MTMAQLDPTTGLLAWPRALLNPEYADLRRALDRMFVQRAALNGAIGNELYTDILDAVAQMNERLGSRIRLMRGINGTRDYIAARKFLESLEYETGFESTEEVTGGGEAGNIAQN